LTISVRQATRHDWPALQRLFLLSRCHTFTWLNVTDFRLTDLEKQTEGETIWLAHDPQGELAGFIAVWMPDHFIHHLHVAPARQGCGVGKMLLQALPGWQEHGYRLKCLTRNRKALAFYAASGFVTIGEGKATRERITCWNAKRPGRNSRRKNAPAGASLTRRGSTLRWPGISPVRRQKQ
jgi:GNAT superfamily N-acetyltransferase